MAPASRAARILNGMPPMGETSPAASIAPVPATNRPPVSSPGESLSTTASANIRPAEGPPMSPRLIRMSPARGSTVGRTPSRPWARSGLAASATSAVRSCPSRRYVTDTLWPGAVPASASATLPGEPTVRPETVTSSSPTAAPTRPGVGHDRAHDDPRGDGQLGHRGELGVGLGGGELLGVLLAHLVVGLAGREDLAARHDLAAVRAPRRRNICTNVMPSETATVVMLVPATSGRSATRRRSTTGAPLTSPSVS